MLCPKCHRPLEDDAEGAYICCAGSALRWRCTRCAKVSEGFAMPYGVCPHCGGALELAAPRPVGDTAAVEAVRLAFEIELGGRGFYQRAAAESTDPALRELFGRFAVMEGEHMETLARRYHLDVPAASPALRLEVAAIFAGVDHRPADPDNLFEIAVALEKRAADFFTGHAARADADRALRELFLELAAEEREHAELLATEHERWREGRGGLLGVQATTASTAAAVQTTNAAAVLLGDHDPQRPALVCGDEVLRYGELRDRVARAAGALRARGVEPGARVAIKLLDSIDWAVTFLGAIWYGAVAVGVNPRIPATEWEYILDEAGFSLIVAESTDDTPMPWLERVVLRDSWRAEVDQAAPMQAQATTPDAPAVWCHSSGTSGKPKAVIHAHRFAGEIERVSSEAIGIVAGDRMFASSRLFFSYPQTNLFYAGLKLGATLILDPQWPTAQSVAATVAAQRPTVLLSVPSLYRNMLNDGLAPAIAAAGVRICVSAGEAMPASLRDGWRRQTGLEIVNGYGASETLILVMTERDGDKGFVPSPGVEIRPLDDVPVGSPTRLLIRSSTLALGYLDRPQAQAESFRGGAFCPADLFARNEAGGWRFAGREDSLVKIRGRFVNLVELEEKLSGGAPGVAEAAAVCVPDEDGVDTIALFYVASDAQAALASLQQRIDALPTYQRPRWLYPVQVLPRTATGKLQRRRLQDLHRSGEVGA